MSIRSYGRVTPLQMDMLGLGGEILLSGGIASEQASDEQRLGVMKQARQTLMQRSGRDFGSIWPRGISSCSTTPSCRKNIRSITPGRRSSSGSTNCSTIPTDCDL